MEKEFRPYMETKRPPKNITFPQWKRWIKKFKKIKVNKKEELEDESKVTKLEPVADYELFVLDIFKTDQTIKTEKDLSIVLRRLHNIS